MTKLRKQPKRLSDAYAFPGFHPQPTVRGIFGDPKARVITLLRRSKKQYAAAVVVRRCVGMTDAHGGFVTWPVGTPASIWSSTCGACNVAIAAK